MKLIRPTDSKARPDDVHFTSTAWLEEPPDPWPGGLRATVVHFSPTSRNNWHHHPGGQVLYVLAGRGKVAARSDGGAVSVEELAPGDIVIAEPGECHWHGAADDSFMSHLAVATEDTVWSTAGPDEEPDCRPT